MDPCQLAWPVNEFFERRWEVKDIPWTPASLSGR